jgi:hypothetical protein
MADAVELFFLEVGFLETAIGAVIYLGAKRSLPRGKTVLTI